MADNDIYNSEEKYKRIKKELNQLLLLPGKRKRKTKAKYYCRNPKNPHYFKKIFSGLEGRDVHLSVMS